jgi:hypothetical protein
MRRSARYLFLVAVAVAVVVVVIGAAFGRGLLAVPATVAAFALLQGYVLAANGRPRSLIDWLPVVGAGGLLVAAVVVTLAGPSGAGAPISDTAPDEATWLIRVRELTVRAMVLELMLATPLIIGCVGLLLAAALPGRPGRLRRPLPALLTGVGALLVTALVGLVIWDLTNGPRPADRMDLAERSLSMAENGPRLVTLLTVAAVAVFAVNRSGSWEWAAGAGAALLVASAARPLLFRGGYPTPHRPDTEYLQSVVLASTGGIGIDGRAVVGALIPLVGALLHTLAAMSRAQPHRAVPTAGQPNEGT